MNIILNTAWSVAKIGLLVGVGAVGMYNLTAWSIVEPPTPATAESLICQRFGRANQNFPAQYDRVASQEPYDKDGKFTGGCKGFIKLHRYAYPNKPPVPLTIATTEETPQQGKP
jgi:hypothetical protein